jgi:hypothetical protein
MTFGVLGILIAVSTELGMVTHWLWFTRGVLARRKPHISHVMVVTHTTLMFVGSVAIAALLYVVLVPIEAQPVPVGLTPYIAPALAFWAVGCGYLCWVAIIGAIKNERST